MTQIIPFDSAPQLLRDAAHEFCKRELILPEGETEWDLSSRLKAWIEVENGEVKGVASIIRRIDIVDYRCTTARGNAKMNQRLHSYLADQGLLGQDVFIQFSSGDQSKMCENWAEEMKQADARPANRYLVKVKPL
jgi:hypothetical protein